jgi:hypothetical protein
VGNLKASKETNDSKESKKEGPSTQAGAEMLEKNAN